MMPDEKEYVYIVKKLVSKDGGIQVMDDKFVMGNVYKDRASALAFARSYMKYHLDLLSNDGDCVVFTSEGCEVCIGDLAAYYEVEAIPLQ